MNWEKTKLFLRNRNVLATIISVVLVINLVIGYNVYSETKESPDDSYSTIYKFMYVLQKVRKE